MIVLFRVGRDQLLVGLGLSRFPVGLPLYLVFIAEQVKKGDGFVVLARLIFFCFALNFLRNCCVGVGLPGVSCWAFAVFCLSGMGIIFLLSSRGWLVCFTSSSALGVFFWAFVRYFLFARWRQGKRPFYFARLIFFV